MKKYYLIITIFSVLIVSCQNGTEKSANSVNKDSLLNGIISVKTPDKSNEKMLFMADSVNDAISKHLVSSLALNYPFEDSKEKLTLFYDKKQAIKLVYPKFGVTGEVEGIGEYYFKNGEVFLNVEIIDSNKNYIYIDLINHRITNTNKSKSIKITTKVVECSIIKEIDNFMRLFSTLAKYRSFECMDSGFDLLVNADSIKFFKSQTLIALSYLPYGTRLKYIQRSSKDEAKHQYIIKVNAEKLGIGWVYYNPDNLIDTNELD
jgi:hypothetical protein